MTISHRVKGAFFDKEEEDQKLIRLAPNAPPTRGPTRRLGSPWTSEEHDRFLEAMEMYPYGPWKLIATHVGTRSTRQTMTHAQKYRQKIARWKRGSQAKLSPSTTPPPQQDLQQIHIDETEDALFWQALEEITLGSDEEVFEAHLADLLNEYEPLEFTSDAPDMESVVAELQDLF